MAATPILRTSAPRPGAWPEGVQIALDDSSYIPGSRVRFRLIAPEDSLSTEAEALSRVNLSAVVFRAGRHEPICRPGILGTNISLAKSVYETAWRIPKQALSGRYSLVIEALDCESGLPVWKSDPVSFAVWRSEIVVEEFDTGHRFYAPGDSITFTLTLVNRSGDYWKDLSVEVGEAQYPWISPPRGSQPGGSFTYPEPVCLAPGESRIVTLAGVTNRKAVGSVQYTATVRSGGPSKSTDSAYVKSKIVAFRTASPVFLRNPGASARPVYPAAYTHSDLSQVRVEGYRMFYSGAKKNSWFEDRTSYRAGDRARIRIRVDSKCLFRGAVLELRNSSGQIIDRADAQRDGTDWQSNLQFGPPGLYTVVARVKTRNGGLREVGRLEIAANVLPRSLVVVCAHPDDEFLHPGIIRAAIENSIPVHLIYLTNGDAGGSDRFFGAQFTPAEAIEFGHIRMAEARAAAQHLGILQSNLHFMGLPDGFLEAIRTADEHEGPIFSPLLGTEHSPYLGVREPNLRFQKRSVLKVLADLFGEIDPDTVYISHPDERHSDHGAAAWLTIESLRALLGSKRLSSIPMLRADQFYGPSDSIPAPFSYRPHEFFSSGEAMARIQEAYWYYQTQGGNHARGHLLSYADLPRVEHHQEIVDWAHRGRFK